MKNWEINQPKELIQLDIEDTISIEEMAKVKITKATISRYEYLAFNGVNRNIKYPFHFGRNAVGIVVEAKEDSDIKKGDRVFIEPYIRCGECINCKNDIDPCLNIKTRGIDEVGLIADFVRVPYENLIKLPDSVEDEEATLLDYISTGIQVFSMLDLKPSSTVIICGSGLECLVLGQLASYYKYIPICITRSGEVRDFYKKEGIYYSFDYYDENLDSLINDVTCGRKAEALIFHGTQSQSLNKVIKYVANLGQVIFLSQLAADINLNLKTLIDEHLTMKINYFGSNKNSVISAINMLVNKHIKLDNVIEKRIHISELENELRNNTTYELNPSLKTIIDFK